ncbi:MAG: glucose-6-phosphate dehydrogenase [Sedimentisphaerales bacterium]|nr:glucose-6-phosphate dehydrogenase [Sedimentisphaerales bacterium]
MVKIRPVAPGSITCAEIPPTPCVMVIFGASGDLATRKLIPAIAQLHLRGLLDEGFCLVGCGRTSLSTEAFRERVRTILAASPCGQANGWLEMLLSRTFHVTGRYEDRAFYDRLKSLLVDLDCRYRLNKNVVLYLALPPGLYPIVASGLASSGLVCPDAGTAWDAKLVLEKPFGMDLATARQLNSQLSRCIPESRIYRIDHYLGKETVQNILVLRFANSIFEPLWNNRYIDHIQITMAEQVGVGQRGRYYDQAGALRDMVQGHLLGVLALVAMDEPEAFDPEAIRDQITRLLEAIRPFSTDDLQAIAVRAQYGPGTIEGQQVCGYRQEEHISPDSQTETYVALKLFVDHPRWQGVPFYLRTGKRLAAKDSHVAICFKPVAQSFFRKAGLQIPQNILLLRLQPDEGISVSFQAKLPGSKLCLGTLQMAFNYQDLTDRPLPDAYQRLLLDCMHADQTLFTRYDSVEVSWQKLEPILAGFSQGRPPLCTYPAGTSGPPEADQMIQQDGRHWLQLTATVNEKLAT